MGATLEKMLFVGSTKENLFGKLRSVSEKQKAMNCFRKMKEKRKTKQNKKKPIKLKEKNNGSTRDMLEASLHRCGHVIPESHIENMNNPHIAGRLLRHSWVLSLTLVFYYVRPSSINDSSELQLQLD